MSAIRAVSAQRDHASDEQDATAAFDRLAHDLRSPLASVRTALQMLRMTGLDPAKTRELVDLADRQLMRAVALSDAVGDYARLRNGRLELAREPITAERLLHDVSDRIRGTSGAQPPSVAVDPGAGTLSADPLRLSQAIALLLEPATRSGKHVALRARRDGETLLVEASAELDTRSNAIPDLLGEALVAAHGGHVRRDDAGLQVTLPASG
ncbi:MAG TPA: histidine kinase dimerization/phospho-acceptor domain-containing protein [Xanthomonadales bacterium]|nr:histidine kinase dimerization/phospho-acceptor domain-containing protein [Xanthomonadales bacterium]